jgi:hypothetical protein
VKTAVSLLATSLALALAPAASAQATGPIGQTGPTGAAGRAGTTGPTGPTGPTTQPPAAARIAVRLDSGLPDHGRVYVAQGDRVTVRGTLKPFVAGQNVLVELFSNGKRVARATTNVHQGGVFSVKLPVRRSGSFGLWATHAATSAQKRAKTARLGFTSLVPSAHVGSSGANVRVLQHALARLAYVTPRGGRYDAATARAVLAFRKVNKMARTGSVNRTIFRMLLAGQGGYRLRYPNAGKHVEFDWSRQVLVLARGGVPERIYHASSGKPSTPTVFGTFRFYRKSPGTNSHGMVDSSYFIGGYAIHGYSSVPSYAASHGCIRVPIPNARSIFDWVSLGDRIFVYR